MYEARNDVRDLQSLRHLFTSFQALPFPDVPEDDRLVDVYSELVAYDSHVAGVVSTVLGGKVVPKTWINFSDKLDASFNEKEFIGEVEQLRAYKRKIDDLLRMCEDI